MWLDGFVRKTPSALTQIGNMLFIKSVYVTQGFWNKSIFIVKTNVLVGEQIMARLIMRILDLF